MKRISILMLHLSYGGIEKAVTDLANLLADEYEVEIYCLYSLPIAYEIDNRIKVTFLTKDVPNKQEFMQAIKRVNILKILKEGLKAVRILRTKSKVMKNTIQSLSNNIIISTRNEFNVMLSKYGNDSNLRIAQLHHDIYYDVEKTLIDDLKNNYQNIDYLVLLVPSLVTEVQDIFAGHNDHTIPVAIPLYYDFNEPIKTEKRNIVISVGRLHSVKGFDRLISIFKEINLPDWQLWIVGGGEEFDNLAAISDDYENIKLLGKKEPQEINALLSQASIYAMTSHSEGFGYVLLEALGQDLPIIAYDVRVGPKAILDEAGILIEDNNQEAFVSELKKLMSQKDYQERIIASQQSRKNMFSSKIVRELYKNIFGKNTD